MICDQCGTETRGEPRFCMGCGSAFERSCSSCGCTLPDGARFCPQCASPVGAAEQQPEEVSPEPRSYTPRHLIETILTTRSALEGEHKQITVLFADIEGSVELADRVGPEKWHYLLRDLFETLTLGVHRFEGTINQYTGDGIMALFGAPIAHEDHAQRACYAALWLRTALADRADELRQRYGCDIGVRMGLNSGDVVVGRIGDDLRMDYTAQGLTVGLAQRMESLARAGQVLLAPATAREIAPFFALNDLGEFTLKGIAEPVRACELVGVGEIHSRIEMARERGFSKFVARTSELDALSAALQQARAGRGAIVGIVADAGIGKSRLCYEFQQRCLTDDVLVVTASGLAHARSIPLIPVMELFRGRFGISRHDDADRVRAKLQAGLTALDPTLADELPLMFDFLGVPDPARPAPALVGGARMRQIVEMLRRVMVARSRQTTAVIIFEDLHWIDSATETFLQALADYAENTRTLLVMTFRPEYQAPWTHRSYYTQVSLRPFDLAAVDSLVVDWLGTDPSLQGLSQNLLERTGGTPFFVEEVLQALMESGALAGERGACRLTRPIDTVDIPSRVVSLIAARIDRLPEDHKHVLQAAALIGREFSTPLLEQVAGITGDALSQVLHHLVAREFLYQKALYPELEYAFKHPLTQEVAAGLLLSLNRETMHAAAAQALEQLNADKLDEAAGIIAHHWEGASEKVRAAQWHRRAAQWSGGRHPASTFHHWSRIHELLEGESDTDETLTLRIEARAKQLLHFGRMGLPPEQYAVAAREAESLARASGNDEALALVLQHLGWSAMTKGAPEAHDLVVESTMLADRVGNRTLQAACRCAVAAEHLWYCHGSVTQVEPVVADIRSLTGGDPTVGVEMLGLSPLIFAGWMESGAITSRSLPAARQSYDENLALAARCDDLLMITVLAADVVIGWRSVPLVTSAEAYRYAAMAIEAEARTHSVLGDLMAHWAMAQAHVQAGAAAAAIPEFQHSVDRIAATGVLKGTLPTLLTGMTEALLAVDVTAARDTLEATLAARGEGWDNPNIDIVAARVLMHSEGRSARTAIDSALVNAERLINLTDLHGLTPALWDARAEFAELVDDRPGRARAQTAAEVARARVGAGRPVRSDSAPARPNHRKLI